MTTDNSTSIKVLESVRAASLIVLATAYLLLLFGHTGLIELSDSILRLSGGLDLVAIPITVFASIRIRVLKERKN